MEHTLSSLFPLPSSLFPLTFSLFPLPSPLSPLTSHLSPLPSPLPTSESQNSGGGDVARRKRESIENHAR